MARRADGRVRAERQSAQSKLYAQAGRRPLCRLSPFSLVVLCLMRASISRALAAPCSSKAEPHSRPSCRSDDMAAERAAAPGVAAVWVAFGPGFAAVGRGRSVGPPRDSPPRSLPTPSHTLACTHPGSGRRVLRGARQPSRGSGAPRRLPCLGHVSPSREAASGYHTTSSGASLHSAFCAALAPLPPAVVVHSASARHARAATRDTH